MGNGEKEKGEFWFLKILHNFMNIYIYIPFLDLEFLFKLC